MAAVYEESSDDEIGMNLQLAERLRINRGEHYPVESNKDYKQYCSMHKKKQNPYGDKSSSSSSLEMQNDPCSLDAASSYMHPTKKRHNGDKVSEQFANPKRTCLSDRFRKTPEWRECKVKGCNRDMLYSNTESHNSAFPYHSENSGSKKNLYPDHTYEDHVNNLADAEDSDLDFTPQSLNNGTKGQNPKTSKNYSSSSKYNHPETYEPRATSSRGYQFLASESEDDSKVAVQNGALKGGRQSPDFMFFNKKVLGRKVKKVLDSDDSDDEYWHTSYRSQRLMFSSDSEDSVPKNVKKSSAVANGHANSSLPSGDTYQHSHSRHKPSVNVRSSRRSPSRATCHATSSPNFSDFGYNHLMLPVISSLQGTINTPPVSVNKSVRARRCRRANSSTTNASPENFAASASNSNRPRRGRSRTGGSERYVTRNGTERYPLRSAVSPLPRTVQPSQNRAESAKSTRGRPEITRSLRSRVINAPRSQNDKQNLAATYPDLFDAEDSSEVEFFTANSYSDTETSAESLGGLTINATFVGNPDRTEIVYEHVGSSEDEISVVFSTHSRSSEQRRGASRTLGRRYSRGTGRRHIQNGQEVVSLSPDPVEQVRQVEEDERYARMLQAQFDAEVDPDYQPTNFPLPPGVVDPQSTASDDDTDAFDQIDSDSADAVYGFPHSNPDFPAFLHTMMPMPHRGVGFHRIPSRPGTPGVLPIFLANRSRIRRRWPGNEQRSIQLSRLLSIPVEDLMLPFENAVDHYETFLGIAELNGDVIPRGLERSQINRLPTRKYVIPNSVAASSADSEVTHKRTELNKECQVCLSDYETGDVLRILPCFHEFHTPCIDPWLKINHTCPVCRVSVDLED